MAGRREEGTAKAGGGKRVTWADCHHQLGQELVVGEPCHTFFNTQHFDNIKVIMNCMERIKCCEGCPVYVTLYCRVTI